MMASLLITTLLVDKPIASIPLQIVLYSLIIILFSLSFRDYENPHGNENLKHGNENPKHGNENPRHGNANRGWFWWLPNGFGEIHPKLWDDLVWWI